MVLQGEDVVLTEDILKKQLGFSPTRRDWVVDNEEVVAIGLATASPTFIVPDKKTLYITTVWIEGTIISTASGLGVRLDTSQIVGLQTGSNFYIILAVPISMNVGENIATDHGFATFDPPLKIPEGATITFQNIGVGTVGRAGITGWLESKRIS